MKNAEFLLNMKIMRSQDRSQQVTTFGDFEAF